VSPRTGLVSVNRGVALHAIEPRLQARNLILHPPDLPPRVIKQLRKVHQNSLFLGTATSEDPEDSAVTAHARSRTRALIHRGAQKRI
jgi:hypothetical protein